MRISGVCPDGDDRGRIAHQPLFPEPLDHQLLQIVFRLSASCCQRDRGLFEGPVLDAIQRRRGLPVQRELRCRPGSLELLDEISGRNDFDPPLPDCLNRTGVYP